MMLRQITVAFDKPINVEEFVKIMKLFYGTPIRGEGRAINGIPSDWIIIENDKGVFDD